MAFNLTDRMGSVGVEKLSDKCGGVAKAWAQCGKTADWQREFDLARKYGVSILTPADGEYPEILKNTRGHPLVLYVKGSVAALSRPAIAMVGTRRATAYGLDQANRLAHDLALRGWCIVSGLALGIDAEAHRGALEGGGVTVGVLGSALDQFYPEQNRELAREMVKKGGAVVSEFPFGRGPDQQTFPQRNHVVAALANGVIAVEAPVKSGTLITTSIAADLGRTVMAVPGRVDSRSSAGCLELIRDGAVLVRSAEDVEEECSPSPSPSPSPSTFTSSPSPTYSLEEAMLMRHVDAEGVSIDRLVELTGLDVGKVNALAMALRIRGRARFLPGNRLALPRGA